MQIYAQRIGFQTEICQFLVILIFPKKKKQDYLFLQPMSNCDQFGENVF